MKLLLRQNTTTDDWLAADEASQNNAIWETNDKKTMYDPCPAGWRVPSRNEKGVDVSRLNERVWSVTPYEDKYDASAYLSSLEEAVRVPYDVPTLDLSMALMALYVCDKKPQMLTPALSHLEEIQLSDGGWGKDKDDKARDAYISAMVLNVITAYRKEYSDDNSRDELLTFLGNCIQNDNTIQDGTGASSSLATMGVLNSLIFAGIPANGEISTALCTAVSEYTAGGTFANYKNGAHSEDATAEVFLAFATARRASIFSFFSDEYKDMVNQSK
jgi:hypothetical protein